jgi:predicted DCC family thiol-disulfide oxidoreductase YuxK
MPPADSDSDIIFYDGTCGLCHWFVEWVLAHDPDGVFRFAPLQGDSFQIIVPLDPRVNLPDSIVVRDRTGQLLTRSSAALYIIDRLRLRGFWSVLQFVARLIPRSLRNLFYDIIASVRYRIFGHKESLCPILPPHLRSRFLD